jgi:hypothetical protein
MKDSYDFSKGERGKFYHPGAEFELLIIRGFGGYGNRVGVSAAIFVGLIGRLRRLRVDFLSCEKSSKL